MRLDVLIEEPRWHAPGLVALAERATRASLAHLGLTSEQYEISLFGCDDVRIADLNRDFRVKPVPTNVLSWPSQDRAVEKAGATPNWPDPGELGDIAIAYDTCAREAAEAECPFEAHVTHLLVHGTLHLLGYDHIRDQDATLMEGLEVGILATFGIPDPYKRYGMIRPGYVERTDGRCGKRIL